MRMGHGMPCPYRYTNHALVGTMPCPYGWALSAQLIYSLSYYSKVWERSQDEIYAVLGRTLWLLNLAVIIVLILLKLRFPCVRIIAEILTTTTFEFFKDYLWHEK